MADLHCTPNEICIARMTIQGSHSQFPQKSASLEDHESKIFSDVILYSIDVPIS